MDLIEFYDICGGNYLDIKDRLTSDQRIIKYLLKFKTNDDFINLKEALENNNWNDAFRFSHNLKGLSLNLNLSFLYCASSALCENLRGGNPKEDWKPLLKDVEEAYNCVIKAIDSLTF